jgi:predicted  nucleic acid-binding Zn-ribbon protein
MIDLEQLLIVQGHDTQADQLRHKRAMLPERARAADLEAVLGDLTRELEVQDATRADLARELKKREDELALLEEKIKKEDATLYGGGVSNPRELQALQEEIAGMKRRVSTIEDAVLELLESLEPVEVEVSALQSRRAENADELARVQSSLTAAEAELDVEIDAVAAEREQAAAGIPAALLAEYNQLRTHGGVGVARLSGNRCEGCHLTMAAAEVERIKRAGPDEVAHCEECGRILVH